MENEDWSRLAEMLRARIKELDLKQKEVQDRGGPSPAKVRDIIAGRTQILSPSKRRDLERAIRWQQGDVDVVLAGGDPTRLTSRLDSGLVEKLIPTGAPEHEHQEFTVADDVANLERLVAQGWRQAHALADAVADSNPTEQLLAAARDVVHFIDAYLIIRILGSGHASKMEKWLERIYRERAEMFRQLSVGEPQFPWLTEEEIAAERDSAPVEGHDLGVMPAPLGDKPVEDAEDLEGLI